MYVHSKTSNKVLKVINDKVKATVILRKKKKKEPGLGTSLVVQW